MESESLQSHDETTVTEVASEYTDASAPIPSSKSEKRQAFVIVGKDTQPPAASATVVAPAKGSLAREIGMAIFGQFLTLIVSLFLIFFIYLFTYISYEPRDDIWYEENYLCNMFITFVCIHLLLSIPFVSECVRLGGLGSGGHGKRKRCYIGASITSISMVTAISLILFRIFHDSHVPYAYLIFSLFILVGMTVVIVGTIIGYRKENAYAPQISNGTALLPTGKGNPLAQFVMANLGGILALDIGLVVLYVYEGWDWGYVFDIDGFIRWGTLGVWIALSSLWAIPCVAEGGRLAGKLTGGHGKRMLCYIGTAIVPFLAWYFVGLELALKIGIFTLFAFIAAVASPILIPWCAIKGYQKDAELQNTNAIVRDSNGKGQLWPEIGAGLLGGILAIIPCFILMRVFFASYCIGWSGLACMYVYWPVMSLLFAIPLVAEGVRLAGKRTGGHSKRKRCYIGTAIVPIIVCILTAGFTIFDDYPVLFLMYLVTMLASPILVLVGAIVGYRKDAE